MTKLITKLRGFTLIELLVTIAIIGVLTSVVLASLNEARDKGEDANIKQSLNDMRAQAELVYDNASQSYNTVCDSEQVLNAIRTSTINASTTCFDGPDGWALEGLLSDGTHYCTDFTGFGGVINSTGTSATDFVCEGTGTSTASYDPNGVSGGGGGDVTAPTLTSTTPADNATDISTSANLVMNFDENIATGTGNITIKLTSNDSTVEAIDVASGNITISGSQLTINPTSDFSNSTEYYVQVDTTAVDDTSGNDYAGISDTTSWSFTTGSNLAWQGPHCVVAINGRGINDTGLPDYGGGDYSYARNHALASNSGFDNAQNFPHSHAFAALTDTGSTIMWGDETAGGASADYIPSGVSKTYSTESAFAALKTDGSVVTWGNSSYGADSSSVSGSLTSGVSEIYSTNDAFAALKTDGSVITWGSSINGGNSSGLTFSCS